MVNRYERGLDTLKKMAGQEGEDLVENINKISKDFCDLMIEFGFGDLYSRPALDLKQRELITLSSLITQGAHEHQIYFHMKASLRLGLTPEEIIEIIIQCAGYAGFPRAASALSIAKQVFDEAAAGASQ